MRVVLPNGVVFQPETEEEARFLLRELGVHAPGPHATPAPPTAAAAPVDDDEGDFSRAQWTPEAAARLVEQLPTTSRRLLELVMRTRRGTTEQLAVALELDDRRPIGAMLAAIQNRARQAGLPEPLLSLEQGENRRLVPTQDFRRAYWEVFKQ